MFIGRDNSVLRLLTTKGTKVHEGNLPTNDTDGKIPTLVAKNVD